MAQIDVKKTSGVIVVVIIIALVVGVFVFNRCNATPATEREHFAKSIDKLGLLADKLPHMRLSIDQKVAEFKADLEKAGEDMEKLRALNTRVDKYVAEVEKSTKPPAPAPNTAPAPTPVGSKLGGTPPPVQPPPPANTSGFGGK